MPIQISTVANECNGNKRAGYFHHISWKRLGHKYFENGYIQLSVFACAVISCALYVLETYESTGMLGVSVEYLEADYVRKHYISIKYSFHVNVI